jgi:hypothetical protein
VLDHDPHRLVELERDADGGIQVEEVRVGQLLALVHLPPATAPDWQLPERRLVRVLPVAERPPLHVVRAERGTPHVAAVHLHKGHGLRNRPVVLGRVTERLPHQVEAEREGRPGFAVELVDDTRVVGRIDHHQHIPKVLRRRAQQARSTDVDLLHEVVEDARGIARGGLERIEVHDHEIHGNEPLCGDRRHVVGSLTTGEDAAVDGGMECLDASVHHLGNTRHLRHADDGQTCFLQRLGRPARGHQLDVSLCERPPEIDEAALVGHAQDRPHITDSA